MNTYTVSFFGHRIVENPLVIERKLETIIALLLQQHEYVVFLVGRDGNYDQIVSSTIRRCKRTIRSDNSTHVLVLPYITAELKNNEASFQNYYDEISICEDSGKCYYKNAHQTRNRAMADQSDLVVFCIQHESGGAWQTMKYVKINGSII